MKDNFVNLHVHSTYSFVDGYGTPKQYFDYVQKLCQPALGVTDHGNISAHFKWYQEGKKRGIKPILGCELYVVNDIEQDKEKRDYCHITVLALNNIGYKNLIQLVTRSWLQGFYYKPRVDWNLLQLYKEGLLFTSGCMSSACGNIISNNGTLEQVKIELKRQKKIFGEHFYIELTPLSFESGKRYTNTMYKAAQELKFPMLATMDCHYPESHQAKIQEILLCIQSNDVMSKPAGGSGKKNPNFRWKFDQDDFYAKSRSEMEQSFKVNYPDFDIKSALDNTVKVAEMVDVTFPTSQPLKFPIPQSQKVKKLKELVWHGMIEKGLDKNKEYIERAKYEIDLIIKKDFIDYFLVIADLITYAKRNNILVGPARGSAAGSLICYLTHITEVNPIIHGLIFERFIDINREDIPDIDIDFEDEKRHLVKEYLVQKYGQENVGDIATFGTFKGKMCIADLGRVYKISFAVIEKIKSLLIQRSGGDSRASYTVMDTFEQFDYPKEALKHHPELKYAEQLEGQVRQLSKHAAGVVVSNEPLNNFCAIYQRQGERVISMDYYDASSIGLLKIDILGLSTLTYLRKASELVKQRHDQTIDFYKLPLDDPEVYKAFNDPERLFGVFQFDGQAVNQVCRQVNPKNFSELSDITALARPGPLNSGSTTAYITRKNGKTPVQYDHPYMEKITADTQGIVIYQEQVMRTMRELGNMSWKDTAEIRKNISRSRGVEAFNEFKIKFETGAKENGISQKEIDNIWNSICTFGAWAFNKSHSVSYTYISYWTMWMKVHYPIEYYSAILSTIHKDDTVRKVIKEFRREGFKILPIDINNSKKTFSIDGDGIRLGFNQVKGIGEKTSETLLANQPYIDYNDFISKIAKKRITKKTINLLQMLGAFQSIGGMVDEEPNLFNPNGSIRLWKQPTFEELYKINPLSIELSLEKDWEEFIEKYLIRVPTKISELALNDESQSWADRELFIFGIVYDKNPRDKREVAQSKGLKFDIPEGEPTEFCNFILEDDSDFVTVRIPARIYMNYKKMLFEEASNSDVFYISGRMGSGIRMFFANGIVLLRQLSNKIASGSPFNEIERKMIKPSINKFINI